MFIQLPFMVVQLLLVGSPRSASLVTFKLARILTLLSQLPQARSRWHASTPVGIHGLICACIPSGLRLLVQEVSSNPYRQVTPGIP
jgi:hypothetical protein